MYSILNIDTGAVIAAELTEGQVRDWWRSGMNSTQFSATRDPQNGVIEVSEQAAAEAMKAELDANVGFAMARQGELSLKLDHDKRYWMRQDKFRGATESLDAESTDARRLMAHWLGFVANCRGAARN